jgi:hypothetical protein
MWYVLQRKLALVVQSKVGAGSFDPFLFLLAFLCRVLKAPGFLLSELLLGLLVLYA